MKNLLCLLLWLLLAALDLCGQTVARTPAFIGASRTIPAASGGVSISSVSTSIKNGRTNIVISGSGFGASQGAGLVRVAVSDSVAATTHKYIAFRSVSTVATVATGNLTNNAPSGAAQNDILIAVIACRSNVAFTAPSGGEWTEIVQTNGGNLSTTTSTSIGSGSMWWCRRGASNPNLVWTRTGGDVAMGRILAYVGCVTNGSPLDGTATMNTLSANSATVTTAGITTTINDARVILAFAGADNTTASAYKGTTAPYVLVERADSNTATGADTTLAVADALMKTAGATGTLQFTAGNSSKHVAMACALKPQEYGPIVQTVTSWADTSITITGVRTNGLDIGTRYVFVSNNSGQTNSSGFAATVTGDVLYVNTDSTAGTQDGTTSTAGSSGTAAFASLNAALNSLPATLTDQVTIKCLNPSSKPDYTTAENTYTETSRDNYILVTPETGHRHAGVWDASKYHLSVTNGNGIYNNTPSHFRISGMQCKLTLTAGDQAAFKSVNAGQNEIDVYGEIEGCIAWSVLSGGATSTGFSSRPPTAPGDGESYIYNCISYENQNGFQNDFLAGQFLNCTAYGNTYNFLSDVANMMVVRNSIDAAASGINFVGTFDVGSDYNASSTTGAPGSNSRQSQTFTFTATGSDNYHLQSGDAGAKDFGQTLNLFSTDIDAQTRSGSWDIGADEYQ